MCMLTDKIIIQLQVSRHVVAHLAHPEVLRDVVQARHGVVLELGGSEELELFSNITWVHDNVR
jgi:hypothetical protein